MSLRIGIFTKIFARAQLDQALAAITSHGMAQTQFNLLCAGLPTLPDEIPADLQAAVRRAFGEHGVEMAAVSGTFNMIHPDLEQRASGLRRLRVLLEACAGLGTQTITLCSGTRDPQNMWHGHPGNTAPEAWRDLTAALESVLPLAEARGVTLAIEPETANVIDSPGQARRLLDELRSPRLKVVMDAANLFHPAEMTRVPAVLRQAFALLGGEIALAHAKDLTADCAVVAAGKGVLDYDLYIDLLRQAGYAGALILHSLTEEEVAGSAAFLRARLGA